mmetsp:Transcript_29599/g.48842  ORF Transcript_29599/g.48842 Transcript_29599/m.48842 type:complete len:232 (+) Transcript_29599:13-708(+)|eukprot:CAMPEP_0119004260 /NCGR_PEP_ID=MMETSP1176-20130426/1043_1 /TAXON_ID=265551 /ORGANISM="Synedropsis recta cf, Strain CCMP1620" /LENGTH=231 /DNA_ID=CAMNT_0006955945 /DNA_START=13 /DNA_END=708 /DNA_ORIENTATION=+
MMKSTIAVCIILLSSPITAFTGRSGAFTTKKQHLFGTIADELDEIWSEAASAGQDVVLKTTGIVKDRAFDYKSQAVNRIHTHAVVNQDTIEQAAADFAEVKEKTEKKFDTDYKETLRKAEDRFIKAVSKAEANFAFAMRRIESATEEAIERAGNWTGDVKVRAKSHYIHTTAAAEELFQIAVEKAELNFEEAKIKAEESREHHIEYFEAYGEYLPDKTSYLTSLFGDLIAF